MFLTCVAHLEITASVPDWPEMPFGPFQSPSCVLFYLAIANGAAKVLFPGAITLAIHTYDKSCFLHVASSESARDRLRMQGIEDLLLVSVLWPHAHCIAARRRIFKRTGFVSK